MISPLKFAGFGNYERMILDDEIFSSYDEELLKKLIKISDSNGIGFGEGLQEKDVKEIIKRLGRVKQKEDDELEL